MRFNFQEIIYRINSRPKERLEVFLALPFSLKLKVIAKLSKHIKYDLLKSLPDDELLKVLNASDSDDATDLIQLFPQEKQKDLVSRLGINIRSEVQTLIKYNPKSAAGLMNLDFIAVDENDNLRSVVRRFKLYEKRTGRLPTIVIVKENKIYSGYLPGHELGFGLPTDKVKKYMRRMPSISSTASVDEVIDLFRQTPQNKVVVLDEYHKPLGIIYSDDILNIMREKDANSLYEFAGVKEEEATDSFRQKFKNRYKWLIINLGTAFLASFVISIFNETISRYVLLAVYMPIVAGMGGNAATQTLAVMVRGIATEGLNFRNSLPVIFNEIKSSLLNGILNGFIVGLIVVVLNHNLTLALVLMLAMILNLIVASIAGTIIPLILKQLGKDPASSATIFITTATDVLGFLAFLGLATFFLN